tara:strand:- start:156 stop:1910 length:1755 start_codon:yes stop_codon:yes gene_type:complete
MSYHYGSSSSSSTPSSARQTTVNAQGQIAPAGYHYMPDGTLMSDIEHARAYGGGTIKSFNLDTTNIKASGEKRKFTVTGDGTFSLMIKNESNNYYNFTTNKFQTANTRLANKKIKNTYSGNISFPAAPTTTDVVNGAVTSGVKVVMDNNVATKMEVGDRVTGNSALNAANVTVAALDPDGDNAKEFSMSEAIAIADDAVLIFTGSDQYDVFVFAENGTKQANYNEVRFDDNSIDINSSTGSDSLLLRKVIYQTLDIRLTFSGAIADGSTPTGFSGFSNSNRTIISTQIGSTTGKIPFSFEIEGGSTHSFKVDRNPTMSDVFIKSTRTIGSFVAIEGEDVSGSTYYRWSIDNVDGLTAGMIPVGTNITAGSTVSSYEEAITSLAGSELEQRITSVRKEAIEKTGAPTITRDAGTKAVTTVQTGNIVFNKQQAAALDSDEISIVGFGQAGIKSLTGWDIELTDMITTLTKPTSLVSSSTVSSTTVVVANADGIMDDITTVSGINIDSSVAEPTVTTIGSYSGSTATLTLSSAQSLEAGETLTFNGAARKITISGNLRVISAGSNPAYWDGILGFDLEKFITATDES